MKENKTWESSEKLIYIVSWALGLAVLIFYVLSLLNIGIRLDYQSIIFLALIIILFLTPFFPKIKFGKYFELERTIKQTGENLSDFKQEVRHQLTIIQTNIENRNNNFQFLSSGKMPDTSEIREIIESLNLPNNRNTRRQRSELNDKITAVDEEQSWKLVKTRIEIEKELRRILNKKTTVHTFPEKEVKYISITGLMKMFLQQFPNNEKLTEPFNYFIRIANSVIHGQTIDDKYIKEGINLGIAIYEKLKQIENR